MRYRTILIDDEPLALSRLKRLLSKFEDTFEIISEANNGKEGLSQINELKPDLIFLDIEMPGLNGFQLLEQLDHTPLVIFCTAYDQYAIKAFEENSVDYLLKPVEKERLDKTVQKIKQLKHSEGISSNLLQTLMSQLSPKKEINAITVKSGDKILFIQLSEISHFQADDKYVFLNTKDGKQYLTNQTITALEEKLPSDFIRISRSNIVFTQMIKSMEKSFNGKFVLHLNDQKNTKLESGSSYADNLKRLMEL